MTAAEQAERERAIHDRHIAALYPVLVALDRLGNLFTSTFTWRASSCHREFAEDFSEVADMLGRVLHAIEAEADSATMRQVQAEQATAREYALRKKLGDTELALEGARAELSARRGA